MDIYRDMLLAHLGIAHLPERVECSLQIACEAHHGVMRKSGEEYVSHPVEVAMLCFDVVGLDEVTIAAALLHDVVEDSEWTAEQIAERCGQDVADVVVGVTKLSKLDFPSREAAQIASYRKMILAMTRDIRVIIVKLCDRVHNMRTIAAQSAAAQRRIAEETLNLYAPIAHRLGIHRIKAELEDRAFETLDPVAYAHVAELVETTQRDRLDRLDQVGLELQVFLASQDIACEVSGRVKHLYSVHRKMQVKGQAFEAITDIVALRIIVDRERDCFGALGLVHSRWTPVAGRIKDYISQPKLNGYQSLHTTVYADGQPLEIQIRTWEMHWAAEYGIAAHFTYKERPTGPTAASASLARTRRESFVHSISEGAASDRDPELFYRDLLDHLAGDEDEVYVYTPRGDVKVLPAGSTPIDFAYAIHTGVGDSCVGARVNGRQVPFAYHLRSGDHVEVITREGSTPSRDWLRLVASARAKHKIRAFHSHSERAEQEDEGRRALAAAVRRSHLDASALTGPELVAVVDEMGYRQAGDFYVALGTGNLAAQAVIRHLGRKIPPPVRVPRLRSRQRSDALVDELGCPLDVAWQLARCCSPIPGDDVVAHVQSGRGLVVHRRRCPQLAARRPDPESLLAVDWAHRAGSVGSVRIIVQGDNRPGLLEEVSSQIAQAGGNIIRHTGISGDDASSLSLTVELGDAATLERLLAAIRSIVGVFDAWRSDA